MIVDKLEMGIEVDADGAITAMNSLADAVERVNRALEGLRSIEHGGIIIRAVGDIAEIEIKPKG